MQGWRLMRISAVEISNFRGIRQLHLEDLHHQPLIVLSGANGAGKSLLLEAIYLSTQMSDMGFSALEAGPWGPKTTIRVTVRLTSDERSRLEDLRTLHSPDLSGEAPEFLLFGYEMEGTGGRGLTERWASLLVNPTLSSSQTFGHLDYLPAERHVARQEEASVTVDALSEQRRVKLRQETFQAITNRSVFSLSGVQPVLATLDYLDLINERAGETSGSDYERLTHAFERATGKRIPRPVPDPTGVSGARLVVETQAGVQHGLDRLSSGEQAVLGLMFYAHRLSSAGGVLLIDEPEQHLHPALHSLLLSVLNDVAEQAQIWVVTHSTRLVAAASPTALIHVRPATEAAENQAIPSRDDAARIALLEDLGIDPAEALQADLLLIVEGDSDRHLLSRLLPIETGRVQFVVGQNAQGVMTTSRALAKGYPGAWLAIRDRDLLSDEERQALLEADSNLFVWPQRSIENELLHPALVAETFTLAGQSMTVADVEETLRGMLQAQREQVAAALVEQRLQDAHAFEINGRTSIEQLTRYLTSVRDTAAAKLEKMDGVIEQVREELDMVEATDNFRLLDAKRVIGELVSSSPFANRSKLIDALIATVHRDDHVIPAGLEQLRVRIIRTATVARTNN